MEKEKAQAIISFTTELQQRHRELEQREAAHRKRVLQFIVHELTHNKLPLEMMPFVYDEDVHIAQQHIHTLKQAIDHEVEIQSVKHGELVLLVRHSIQGGLNK